MNRFTKTGFSFFVILFVMLINLYKGNIDATDAAFVVHHEQKLQSVDGYYFDTSQWQASLYNRNVRQEISHKSDSKKHESRWHGGRSWTSKFAPFAKGGNYVFDHGLLSKNELLPIKKVWSRNLPSKLSYYVSGNSVPLYYKDHLYILGEDDHVMKIDANNGKLIWSRQLTTHEEHNIFSSNSRFPLPLVIGADSIFASSADGMIYKLDLQQGKSIWKAYIGHPIRSAIIHEERLILTTADNLILVLSTENGKLLWQDQGASSAFFGGSSIYTSLDTSQPLIMNNNLVAAFSNGSVASWRMLNGQKMWHHGFSSTLLSNTNYDKILTNTDIFDVDAALVRDEQNIYVLSSKEGLVALNYLNGDKIWHLPDVQGFVTPWIVNNKLFVLSDVDDVMLLEAGSGDSLWTYNLRDKILDTIDLYLKNVKKSTRRKILTKSTDSENQNNVTKSSQQITDNTFHSMPDLAHLKKVKNLLYKNRPYWFSPLIINSKIFLVSHIGLVLVLSLADGEILDMQTLGFHIATQPVVSNGRMFLVNSSGVLIAME